MFALFKKASKHIVSPITGTCIRMEEIPDPVFATKMMGDGFAVKPSDNTVVSPVDGEIVMIAASKHAIGLKTSNGLETLVHIGLETVNLNGVGFTVLKSIGDHVKAGEALIIFDASLMSQKGIDMTTMIVFTGGYDKEVNLNSFGKEVLAGEVLIQ